jgi:hypothetical protein
VKRKVPILHKRYQIRRTAEFDTSIIKTMDYLVQAEGEDFARRWFAKVDAFIRNLEIPHRLGNIDPANFSDVLSHLQVHDTETTILFHVQGDTVFLATSGWSGLPWPDVLKETQPEIERQISDMGGLIEREAAKPAIHTSNATVHAKTPSGGKGQEGGRGS